MPRGLEVVSLPCHLPGEISTLDHEVLDHTKMGILLVFRTNLSRKRDRKVRTWHEAQGRH